MPFHERLMMRLRGAPVQQILAIASRAEADGLDLTATDLEAHYLAGGTLEPCLEALQIARHLDVGVDWNDVSMLDLAGRDPVALVNAASVVHERTLEPVETECRDGQRVRATPRIRYRLPILAIAWGDGDEILPWTRVRTRLASLIEATETPRDFAARADAHERLLLGDARLALPSVRLISLVVEEALGGAA